MYRRAIGKMKQWLFHENEEPRRAPRSAQPEVIVYYWDGSAPEGRHIRDLSQSGAYIYTPERWYIGTIVRIVLQYRTLIREEGVAAPAPSTCISARVIRHGSDGVAVEFAVRNKEERKSLRTFLAAIPAQPLRTAFPLAASGREGEALVESALIVPLVFLLAVNAANFGGFSLAWITVAHAARAAGNL